MRNRLIFDNKNPEYTEAQARRIVGLLRSVPVSLAINHDNAVIYPHLCVRGDQFNKSSYTGSAKIRNVSLKPIIPAEHYILEASIGDFTTIREEPTERDIAIIKLKESLPPFIWDSYKSSYKFAKVNMCPRKNIAGCEVFRTGSFDLFKVIEGSSDEGCRRLAEQLGENPDDFGSFTRGEHPSYYQGIKKFVKTIPEQFGINYHVVIKGRSTRGNKRTRRHGVIIDIPASQIEIISSK